MGILTMGFPQLVIFDCDGVLVDSETLGHRALIESVEEWGETLAMEESMRLFRGVKIDKIVAFLEGRFARRVPETFVADFRKRQAALFRAELVVIEGVEQVLDTLTIPNC